jgi:26S proteasome regulatory subunit N2
MFNLNEHTQYVDTLISKCVDKYIEEKLRLEGDEEMADSEPMNPKLEAIINKMFDRCFEDKQFTQAIGVALEARRFDKVKESIEKSGKIEEMLSYTYTLARSVVKSKKTRDELLRLLLLIYENKQGGQFDYFKILKCQFFLKHPDATAGMLLKLCGQGDHLVAYQLAIDVQETENQPFLLAVRAKVEESDCAKKAELVRILTGELHDKLNRQFLKKNNHTDMVLIENMKKAIGEKNSITHGACVWANAIMNAYTTNDVFLRDNINWVAKATNWGRFSATASLGMIHMGNKKEAMQVLQPYFHGQGGADASPYSTAGAYYAYGLIHANQCTPELITYFTDGFRNSGQNESIQHGLCLGLGSCAMATNDSAIYEEFKNIMYTDSAIAGEAAALGMGLVKLGCSDEAVIQDMLTYAGQTKHEKVIRSLAMSLAFLVYGKEEQGDVLIEQMIQSKDSLIRYGAMFAIGMAYAGTSNNDAIKKLLHFAVSDVSDDVKRAAMMNIGFLSFRNPRQIPGLVKQLSDSYNPHLRYGAAMAVGVGCAGTGLPEALKLLAPLTNDNTDFVRQGAVIALAMVFIQVTEGQEGKVETIKKLYTKMSGDKYEEILSRMGSLLAMGIINGGGRNVTISMQTRSGTLRMGSVVGMALFL